MSMFAEFYDENKTREENQKEYEKARHNKECLQHMQVAVAIVATTVGAVLGIKKLYDEFTR